MKLTNPEIDILKKALLSLLQSTEERIRLDAAGVLVSIEHEGMRDELERQKWVKS
jgi:hypothetical protein